MHNHEANPIMPPATSEASKALRSRCLCRGAAVLLGLLLAMPAFTPSMAREAKQDPRNPSGQEGTAVKAQAKYSDVRYISGNRRDPFLNPLLLAKKAKQQDEEVALGLAPPGIAGTYIAQLKLQGLSFRDGRRIAIVRAKDKRAYFLEEGDRLFDGYVKNINLDSITLVRETKLRSGKILTQDVTKRLRTP